MRALVLAAALAVASVTQAATLIDFGTDPGQTNDTTAGFSVWGGYGFAHSRTFSADSVDISYSPTGNWTNAGEQYRGAYFNGVDLSNVIPTDKLSMEARFILGSPAPDFYLYTVTLIAVSGNTSTYQFIGAVETNPAPFSYGTNPATTPFTVVQATTDMAHPTSVGGGGFVFGTDTLAGIDILYQAGLHGSGSFSAQLDNIQVPVPEPTALAGLGMASLLMLRKRSK